MGNRQYRTQYPRQPIGVGTLILPDDVKVRDEYIANCFMTHTVCMLDEENSPFSAAVVEEEVLSRLRFPEETGELGSQVIYINHEQDDIPIIIGIVPRTYETSTLREHMFSFKREYQGNVIQMTGSLGADEQNIVISVQGKKPTLRLAVIAAEGDGNLLAEVQGNAVLTASKNITVNVLNAEDTGTLNLNVQGHTNLSSSKGISVDTGEEGLNLSVKGDITLSTEKSEEGSMNINTKGGVNVVSEGDVTVESKGNATVKASAVTIDGQLVNAQTPSPDPSQPGPFCAIPNCLFSGAPHSSSESAPAPA